MNFFYILFHGYTVRDGDWVSNILGIYSSEERALKDIPKYINSGIPEFSKYNKVMPEDIAEEGFFCCKTQIGELNWAEGFFDGLG